MFITLDPENHCNQDIWAASGRGVITSDNYPFNYVNPKPPDSFKDCLIRIHFEEASPRNTLCFEFFRFDLEASENCDHDYLQFPSQVDSLHNSAGSRYCGNGQESEGLSNIYLPNLCCK